MPIVAIACYRSRQGKSGQLKKWVKQHAPLLLKEGLITSRAPMLPESRNGILVEIFEWASKSAKARAHRNPKVLELWGEMEACGKNVSLSRIGEADDVFANLRAVK